MNKIEREEAENIELITGGRVRADANSRPHPQLPLESYRDRGGEVYYCRSCNRYFTAEKTLVENVVEKTPNKGYLHPLADVDKQ